MRRLLVLLLAGMLCIGLVGCGSGGTSEDESEDNALAAAQNTDTQEAAAEETTAAEEAAGTSERDLEAEKASFLAALEQDGYAEVGTYKVERIQDGVYHMDEGTIALPGGATDADGNMNNPSSIYFVVTDTGVFLVDGGNPPGDGTDTETDAKIIVEAITAGKPVSMIFTHSHGDHTGLARSQAVFENVNMEKVYIGGPDLEAASEAIAQFLDIVETLDREDSISAYGNTYDTYIVNAHTDGALMIVDQANERLFTGDTFGSGFVWVLWSTNDGNPLAPLYDGLEKAREIAGAMDSPVLLAGHRWQQFWTNNPERPEEMTAQYYSDMLDVLDGLAGGETASADYGAWEGAIELSREGAKAKIDTMPEFAEAYVASLTD